MGVYDEINAALSGKAPQGGGSINKVGYGRIDNSGALSIREKMKTLGLDTMPEGGQEQLDQMWQQYQQRQQGRTGTMAGSMRKR